MSEELIEVSEQIDKLFEMEDISFEGLPGGLFFKPNCHEISPSGRR